MHRRLPAWWATPLIGALGGWLATLANWPLPWMIGSLLAVIAVRCSGWLVSEVPRGRQVGQWIVASAIGLHFTSEVMQQVLAHLGVILAGAVGTLLLGLIGLFILLRSGTDRAERIEATLGPKVRAANAGVLEFQRTVESVRHCGVLRDAKQAEMNAAILAAK